MLLILNDSVIPVNEYSRLAIFTCTCRCKDCAASGGRSWAAGREWSKGQRRVFLRRLFCS